MIRKRLKKQSGVKPFAEQHNHDQVIRFFVDRNLGRKVVSKPLLDAGEDVRMHDDYFKPDAKDEEWIPVVCRNGWIILTKDEKIAYRQIEKRRVAENKCKMFVLVSQNLSGPDMGNSFKRALKSIKKMVKQNQGPFIAKVFRDGRVAMWKSAEALLEERT